MEGHFLHLNQGEFYVYSTDGIMNGIDTIKVNGGRFTYEIPCESEGTLMLVFPNFSEQPIFAEPGKSVDISADASHLKEMKVEGTKANKLMTQFRQQIANASPVETVKLAARFIQDNPSSPVSIYLLRNYFILGEDPDLKQGTQLLAVMQKEQKGNSALSKLEMDFARIKSTGKNQQLPSFSATDIDGKPVSNANIKGSLALICTWANWNYDSQNMLRQLKPIVRKHEGRLKLVSISLDASKRECRNIVRRDSISHPVVCDERMFDGPLVQKLGLGAVPDNILVSREGRIIAHGLKTEELKKEIERLLK